MSLRISRRDFLKLAGILPVASIAAGQAAKKISHAIQPEQPNILIVLLDSLSASNMSLYGYVRDTTPNLNRFAERATVYQRHYAGGNFTSPGTASLFTGAYPWSHRAIHMHGTMLETFAHRGFYSLMPEEYYKVAYSHNLLVTALLTQFREDLDELMMSRQLSLFDPEYSDVLFPRDYNVSFWSEHVILHRLSTYPSSLFMSLGKYLWKYTAKKGMEKKLGKLFPYGLPNLNDIYYVLENGVDWMIQNLRTLPQPFLGYFHFLPPHEPYTPRSDFIDKFNDGYQPKPKPEHVFEEGLSLAYINRERQLYDEFLAYSDAEFGRFYDEMQRQGMLENTTIIFTTDHGEMFERGIRGHVTSTLYEPVIRIPLLIAHAGQTQRVDIHTPTSAVDLLPTLLQARRLPSPPWAEGQPLPDSPEDAQPGRSVYTVEAKTNSKFAPLRRATIAMIRDNYKLIHYRGYPQLRDNYEFYDLESDPDEREDLFGSGPSAAKEMKQELLERIDQANQPFSVE